MIVGAAVLGIYVGVGDGAAVGCGVPPEVGAEVLLLPQDVDTVNRASPPASLTNPSVAPPAIFLLAQSRISQ